MSGAPNGAPTRAELLNAVDETEKQLTQMASDWSDGIPSVVRAHLILITNRLLALLIRARRRGQPFRRPQPRLPRKKKS